MTARVSVMPLVAMWRWRCRECDIDMPGYFDHDEARRHSQEHNRREHYPRRQLVAEAHLEG
jgi:hypothetical protein